MTRWSAWGRKSIVERGERGAAAVLSPRAAARFGLQVLADGIESVPENRTRFLVVAAPGTDLPAPVPGATAADGAMRTTLVLGVRNEPGTLLRCLAAFAAHELNLSEVAMNTSATVSRRRAPARRRAGWCRRRARCVVQDSGRSAETNVRAG